MWESRPLVFGRDSQGLVERGGKPVFGFPPLSTARHFHSPFLHRLLTHWVYRNSRLPAFKNVAVTIQPTQSNGAVVDLQPTLIHGLHTQGLVGEHFTDEGAFAVPLQAALLGDPSGLHRSEERRVGKERILQREL